jgi:hypothetical protein
VWNVAAYDDACVAEFINALANQEMTFKRDEIR